MPMTCSRVILFLLAASPHYLHCVLMLLQKLAPCHLAPDHDVRRAQQRHPPPMVLGSTAGVAISLPPSEFSRHEDSEQLPAAPAAQLAKDRPPCSRYLRDQLLPSLLREGVAA